MEFNICPECKTENELQYKYCKNCGCDLKTEENTKNEEYKNNYTPFGAKKAGVYLEYINGIPSGEVATYIGKKSSDIIPKFFKMELANSKISWCWPVAVLSFLFGPMGTAMWFLYRKMYKIALVFMAIGILLSGIVFAVSGGSEVFNFTDAEVEQFISSAYQMDSQQFTEFFMSNMSARGMVAEYINDATHIVCLIVSGMFAYHWYKRDITQKIYRYRNSNVDSRYYQMGIMSIGGTAGGMMVLGIIGYTVITDILLFLLGIIF